MIRYVRGNTRVGGQDVDVPMVLTHRSGQHVDLPELLGYFEACIRRSYPRSKISRTKNSIKLALGRFPYAFDIVPMVQHPQHRELELLFRRDGEKVVTSVSGHVRFVRSRTQTSKRAPGTVAFNDMVRLFKWWNQLRLAPRSGLGEVPSFLLELLCGSAFDAVGVQPTYTETLSEWMRWIAGVVNERRTIDFSAGHDCLRQHGWIVRDPMNPQNLVVPDRWGETTIDEFGQSLEEAARVVDRVLEHDRNRRGKQAANALVELFGPLVSKE